MKNKIRKATHEDSGRLAVSLARAFEDDPFINWLSVRMIKEFRGWIACFTAA